MEAERHTEIKLTESLAMDPAASVCGLYFAHPSATSFAVGKITENQVCNQEQSRQHYYRNLSRLLVTLNIVTKLASYNMMITRGGALLLMGQLYVRSSHTFFPSDII